VKLGFEAEVLVYAVSSISQVQFKVYLLLDNFRQKSSEMAQLAKAQILYGRGENVMQSTRALIVLVLTVFAFSIPIEQLVIAQDDIDCLAERTYHIVYADDILNSNLSLDSLMCSVIFGELGGADLSGADLSGAHLAGLTGTGLHDADLSSANLNSANLSGADLSFADLSGANLSSANLSGADLSSTNLFGADLSGADLSNANLNLAVLAGTNLSGADLSDAILINATLPDAKLWTPETDMERFTDPEHPDFWSQES